MSLFTEPAPDFTDPLGLIAACHRRMLGQCELLERILLWLPGHGADAEVRASAARIARYFDTAAPLHHADEEQDLFPMLETSDQIASLVTQLRQEHERLEASWQALSLELEVLAQGRVQQGLAPAVARFVGHYREHIETEETRILPAARERLGPLQVAALGAAMARRRGLTSTAADPSGV